MASFSDLLKKIAGTLGQAAISAVPGASGVANSFQNYQQVAPPIQQLPQRIPQQIQQFGNTVSQGFHNLGNQYFDVANNPNNPVAQTLDSFKIPIVNPTPVSQGIQIPVGSLAKNIIFHKPDADLNSAFQTPFKQQTSQQRKSIADYYGKLALGMTAAPEAVGNPLITRTAGVLDEGGKASKVFDRLNPSKVLNDVGEEIPQITGSVKKIISRGKSAVDPFVADMQAEMARLGSAPEPIKLAPNLPQIQDPLSENFTQGGQSFENEILKKKAPTFLSNTRGFSDELRGSFENWVNGRHATDIEGQLAKRVVPQELDKLGVQGIKDFQAGSTTGSPDNQSFSSIKNYFDTKYKQLQDAGINFQYKQDYLPQLWQEKESDVLQKLGRRMSAHPSFTLESVLKDYEEGIKAGLTPKFKKVSDLVGWYESKANKAIADKGFLDHLINSGSILPDVKATGQQFADWKTLDPDRFPRAAAFDVNGKITKPTNYKAPPALADAINNYLSQPRDFTNAVARFTTKAKNISLSGGVPLTGWNAHGFNLLARSTLADKNPVAALLRGTYWLTNPRAAASSLEANLPFASRLVKEGGMMISTEDHAYPVLEEKAKGLYGKINAIQSKFFEDPLFKKVVPAWKTQYGKQVYDQMIKSGVPDEQAIKIAGKAANTMEGGMNIDAIGRDKNFQNTMRTIFLAPDWAESGIRLGQNVIKGTVNPKNWGKPEFAPYRTYARNLVLALITLQLANKKATGHYSWENSAGNEFNLETGTYTSDGKARAIKVFGSSNDFLRLPFDAISGLAKGDPSASIASVTNRLSIPLAAAGHIAFNTDFMGRPLYGKDRYGNPLEPKDSLVNLGTEAAGIVGIPQQSKALADYATGSVNGEQAVSQSLELPIRYSGGAFSANQKETVASGRDSGQSGKEIYDTLQQDRQDRIDSEDPQPSIFDTIKNLLGIAKPAEAQASEVNPGSITQMINSGAKQEKAFRKIDKIIGKSKSDEQSKQLLAKSGIDQETIDAYFTSKTKSLSPSERADYIKEQDTPDLGKLYRDDILTPEVAKEMERKGYLEDADALIEKLKLTDPYEQRKSSMKAKLDYQKKLLENTANTSKSLIKARTSAKNKALKISTKRSTPKIKTVKASSGSLKSILSKNKGLPKPTAYKIKRIAYKGIK